MNTIGNSSKGKFDQKPKFEKKKTQEKPKKSFFTTKVEDEDATETKTEE